MKLSPLEQYGIVTANYWAFTLTDGALRMLVVFLFHQLGFTTLEIAALFLFYELFRGGHQPLWRLDRCPLRASAHPLDGHIAADPFTADADPCRSRVAEAAERDLRDGGSGHQWHRQRSQQDECQERHQDGGARNIG